MDGQTLTRAGFKERLAASRAPFPDLHFELSEVIAENDRVAIAWNMRGTQTGSLGPLPPTGKPIDVQGMTVYYFQNDRITGHRQVVDRIAVVRQLGIGGGGGPA